MLTSLRNSGEKTQISIIKLNALEIIVKFFAEDNGNQRKSWIAGHKLYNTGPELKLIPVTCLRVGLTIIPG